MYFWRIENLKAQLASRPLSDREVLPYFAIFLGVTSAAWFMPLVEPNLWDHLLTAVGVLLAVPGTVWIYRRNGGAVGQHFLQRYLAVGWVVGIRWLVVVLPSLMLYFAVLDLLDVEAVATTWHDFILFSIALLLLYWRIGHHIADIAARSAASNQSRGGHGE
jgi:hypothetical protein